MRGREDLPLGTIGKSQGANCRSPTLYYGSELNAALDSSCEW